MKDKTDENCPECSFLFIVVAKVALRSQTIGKEENRAEKRGERRWVSGG